MIKLVLDTNVLVSAILNPRGKPAFILKLALKGAVELVISQAIIKETHKVLYYPKLIKLLKKNGVTAKEVEAFIDNLGGIAEITKGELVLDVIKADPTDNIILACAVEGGADFIISGDSHLLTLANFEGIDIVEPATLLELTNIKYEK
ncbi:MAG TPA: putative toxin-antitoxin system toxin component, PIN family [Thermodesulfobacteriota bacterium]|nr:putative toxin-antitoxin system toxin component, PIN family [Thermodesulfobacteriota bacterium]